ncbi:TPR repeat, partial [Ruminococcus sp. YE71]|uniref:relaxase MobL n=1 Tax=Ruminococcus sp. YE71 TaxID=244362 RepID=UPI0009090842
MPAVVLKTSFRYTWDIGGYLDYMERPEAFSNRIADKKSEYYDYLEYMGNDDKSDGLFSASSDLLGEAEKQQLRQLERSAMEQGCPKYLGVISFDNNYLIQNGWIVGTTLDKDKLKDCARKAIAAMINESDKLDADNVVWIAAIHTNTDNVHIHFQLIEKERREDRRVTYSGKGRDKIETGAFEKLKSTVLSDTLTRKQTPIITEIERKILVPSITEKFSPTAEVNDLMNDLPPTNKAWQYGRAKMLPYRDRIKRCVDEIIESDSELSAQFDEFKAKLENMSRQYRELYGKRTDIKTPVEEYAVNHIEDFYNAAGNKLLQEIYKLKYEDDAHEPTMTEEVKKAAAPNLIKEKNRNLRSNVPIPEDSDPVDESYTYEYEKTEHEKQNISDNRKGYKLDWSKEYKKAQKIIYNRDSTADDIKTAEKILLAESGKGNALATFALGKLYSTEKLGTKDETKSYQYYELALTAFRELEKTADKQKPYLQYRIGKMYQYGLGTETDYIEAHDWFERSANQNNKYAQFSLANMYYYGTGVEQDFQKAFEWYERSYQQGMPYAAFALGQMYSRGQYVDKDDEKAQKCYKEALQGFLNMETDAADDNLLYKIGQMYRDGKGTKSDIAKALKFFERSAELNN